MKILGLDLSLLSTGVCVLEGDPNSPPNVKTYLLPKPQSKTTEEKIDRLISIASDIVRILKEEQPEVVVIEAPAMNQVYQMANIGEVHGVVKVQIRLATGMVPMIEQATKMRLAVVGSIERKFETVVGQDGTKKRRIDYGTIPGKKGKPKKANVKDIIQIRLQEQGLTFPTQDEMDAYVAARYCWNRAVGPTIDEGSQRSSGKRKRGRKDRVRQDAGQ